MDDLTPDARLAHGWSKEEKYKSPRLRAGAEKLNSPLSERPATFESPQGQRYEAEAPG
jgi:hypothetical protein